MYHTTTVYVTQSEYQKYLDKLKKPKQLKKIKQMQLHIGVKQLHFCQKLSVAILLTSDAILVANTLYGQITCVIKKLTYPRNVTLSNDGKLIIAYYSDNTVTIMDLDGRQVSNVIGIPHSSNIFILSKDAKKLMYGNNQQICIWDIQIAQIQVMTRQWKNINCYALSDDGKQFALGTYSGQIFVLTIVGQQRVTEFMIKRHTKCIMCITFHGRNIVSVSYDKLYVETIIETNAQNEKVLTSNQHLLNDVPRSLISRGDKVYMSYMAGLYWLENGKMLGFSEGVWNVIQTQRKEIIFVKYDQAQIQWWRYQ